MRTYLKVITIFVLFTSLIVVSVGPAAAQTDDNSTDVPIPNDSYENKSTSVVGYWDGVWYNDTFEFDDNESAYLNRSQQLKVLKRTMARVEVIRNDTFQKEPPLNIIPRQEYQYGSGGYDKNTGSAARWNNRIWEALFIVNETKNVEDDIALLYGGQTNAFYSPEKGTINVIVKDSQSELVQFDTVTLAHELVHAYQDQRFNLQSNTFDRTTQDGELAKNSLIEGESIYVEKQYDRSCSSGEWSCYEPRDVGSQTDGQNINPGLHVTAYFPYSDGYAYVKDIIDEEGWTGIEQEYSDIPRSTNEIIHYNKNITPTTIEIEDESDTYWRTYTHGENGIERVGEATLAVMFWYQNRNYNIESSVSDKDMFYPEDGSEYDYNHSVTNGLESDAILPYYHQRSNQTGYIFKTKWESEYDADLFKTEYEQVLSGHSGNLKDTLLDGKVYYIPDDHDYSGVYYIEQNNTSVIVTHSGNLSAVQKIQGITDKDTSNFSNDSNRISKFISDISFVQFASLSIIILIVLGYATKILLLV